MSQQINLFNPRFSKQKNYFSAAALAAALGVVLLVSLSLGVAAKLRVGRLEQEAAQVQAEHAKREARKASAAAEFAPRQRSATLQQELDQADSENRALRAVSVILDKGEFGNTRGYSSYFRAFARSRVNGLWLTGVQITGAGNEIGLQGRALQASLLPGYLSGLAREPVLKGTTFGHLEMNQPKAVPAQPGMAGTAAPAAAPAVEAPFVEFSLQAMPGTAKPEAP
ncbi:MSHA biogenesis protein MshI [Pseudoduganella sp. LjRoot289]|uniref:MSHA biogenesis protein MshI n=1 Tax=Pseudoduganella sp. LjRoot289 TaxID=3342314 RepID=UPI003ECD7CCF